ASPVPSRLANKDRFSEQNTSKTLKNRRLWTGTSYGGFYAWEFERDGHEVRVRVDGQVAFNGVPQIVKAALDGFGLTYVHEDVVREYLKNGRLVQVLDDWTPPFPGYHLYYPSRRHPSPAFTLLVEALKE
ncbi:LysR substrate-binding domain-containing protein, partial [Sinorhizobium meliloti]|uniref:LysR substrate-binding domain-containing protein n=1 Tax=Rhizobium meliloti TaxID=382 RepID=UPI001F1C50C6